MESWEHSQQEETKRKLKAGQNTEILVEKEKP